MKYISIQIELQLQMTLFLEWNTVIHSKYDWLNKQSNYRDQVYVNT